ncbi:hypothetical protein HNP38_001787 [Chryseobacterium defluvii]|uniref:Uncharacterized protein n=1 Tax=Chryseobacterium defluvii TaxID=160396 RepID=A0A840KAN1_9FLAO|nr:hypothetical protein [Chryseobacterium defluvii]MBB4806491.1 hypothetical protein [Chryseobacterium defluvii]
MKKGLLIAASFILLSIGCKKNESGNKSIIKSDRSVTTITDHNGKTDSLTESSSSLEVNGKKTEVRSSVYKATDGSLVKVVFTESPKESTVAITSNKKTFTLPKLKSTTDGALYQKDDMKAEVKGDSLILDQGNAIIQLVKTKI